MLIPRNFAASATVANTGRAIREIGIFASAPACSTVAGAGRLIADIAC